MITSVNVHLSNQISPSKKPAINSNEIKMHLMKKLMIPLWRVKSTLVVWKRNEESRVPYIRVKKCQSLVLFQGRKIISIKMSYIHAKQCQCYIITGSKNNVKKGVSTFLARNFCMKVLLFLVNQNLFYLTTWKRSKLENEKGLLTECRRRKCHHHPHEHWATAKPRAQRKQ